MTHNQTTPHMLVEPIDQRRISWQICQLVLMVILRIFLLGLALVLKSKGEALFTPTASTFNAFSEHRSVGGVKVSIVAFQAIDPGSIPG